MRKRPKALFDDSKAVSPVIGVILMVAITVILAAVIGTMVMDMTENVGSATPTAQFDTTDHADAYAIGDGTNQTAYRIEHRTGDDIQLKNVQVLVKSADGTILGRFDTASPNVTQNGNTVGLQYNGQTANSSQTMQVSDSLTLTQLDEDTDGSGVFTGVGDDHQIELIYSGSEGGSTLSDSTVTLQ